MPRNTSGVIWLPMALLIAAACAEAPQAPEYLQAAKGGRPGKPGTNEVTLLEYWIDANNTLHIRGEGDVDEVNATVVHDYFFNGIRDDDFSIHYEYFHGGPPRAATVDQGDGTFTASIPWTGQRGGDSDYFRDFAVTNVDGTGSDPFAFALFFLRNGEVEKGIQPQGVILNGTVVGPTATLPNGDPVTSFALFQGAPAVGTVWVDALSLSGASCATGKRKGDAVTRVSGHVRAEFEASTDPAPSVWAEYHLSIDGTLTDGTTYDSGYPSAGVADFDIYGEVAGERSSVTVALHLDYLYPSRDFVEHVYDPSGNNVTTLNAGPVSGLGDPVPTAVTQDLTITCGHGKP